MNHADLAQKIKTLDALSYDEKAALIELLHQKKYGLVWENKPETVEEELRTQLPILHEVTEKRILGKSEQGKTELGESVLSSRRDLTPPNTLQLDFGENPNLTPNLTGFENLLGLREAPNHTLIEGDNLHALTVLNYTHAGAIDVIYIDPPYNTGNKDFKYNDRFIDREDGYRHSKWLSFMDKRLRLAKNLLKDSGVIFISIDDNEQAQLKLLCDEIFGEENFVANVIWRSADSSNNDVKQFSLDHNHTLIYSKQSNWRPNSIERTEDNNQHYKNPDNDPNGPWFSGNVSSPNPRKNLQYTLTAPNGNQIEPPTKGWRWSIDRMNEMRERIIKKTYLKDQKGLAPSSLWWNIEETGHNRNAKYELIKLFPELNTSELFSTPKPTKFINKILRLSTQKSAKVLDFFAGSGTTLHAVMALNAEDGGQRECILVTNNENNICEEVTYERNKRVIQGYTNAKGEPVAGLSSNNLRYYKTGYVGREKTLANKRVLMALATEMLCLKEDVYEEKDLAGFENGPSLSVRVFQANDRAFMVVYDDTHIPQAVSIVQAMSAELLPNSLKVYVFSEGQDPYTEDFEEVAEWVQLVALPDAIYRAYQHLLPREMPNPLPGGVPEGRGGFNKQLLIDNE